MLFEIERSINGKTPEQRLVVRREQSRSLIAELEIWMHQQRALLSTKNDTAKAINYLLNRWAAFTRFIDDGRVCLTNNAAERALRGVAIGRRNWTFAGSDAGGHCAAAVYTLIETCKMKDVELADVLARFQISPPTKSPTCFPGIGRRTNPKPPLRPERFAASHHGRAMRQAATNQAQSIGGAMYSLGAVSTFTVRRSTLAVSHHSHLKFSALRPRIRV